MLTIIVTCTRPAQIFAMAEVAEFEVSVVSEAALPADLEVTVQFSCDTQLVLSETTFRPASGATHRVRGAMPYPGFLRCRAFAEVAGEKVQGECGVAFAPECIRPVRPEPADFDAFWTRALARLDEVPPDVDCQEAPDLSTDDYTAYRVSLANIGGTRLYGLLTVPSAKYGPGPFPAVFEVPSAGPPVRSPEGFAFRARPRDYIIFNVNVFDFDSVGPDASASQQAYAELTKEGTYTSNGQQSREEFFYYRPVVGCHRAVQWLYERDDVDRRHFVCYGGSQGGGMGFNQVALGGGRFTAALFHIPFLCDTGGVLIGRHPGRKIAAGVELETALRTMAYFDPVYFARRITCPVMVTIGFVDNTCCPSGIYAAYNQLAGEKVVLNCLESGHGKDFNYGRHRAPMYAWLTNRMRRDFE